MSFEKWLIFFFIVNERFCNLFTEAENTPKRLSKLKNVEYKISAKNDPHRLKDGTYFPMFRRVQPIFCPYSVINNYRLECFKIERKLFLITNLNPKLQYFIYPMIYSLMYSQV